MENVRLAFRCVRPTAGGVCGLCGHTASKAEHAIAITALTGLACRPGTSGSSGSPGHPVPVLSLAAWSPPTRHLTAFHAAPPPGTPPTSRPPPTSSPTSSWPGWLHPPWWWRPNGTFLGPGRPQLSGRAACCPIVRLWYCLRRGTLAAPELQRRWWTGWWPFLRHAGWQVGQGAAPGLGRGRARRATPQAAASPYKLNLQGRRAASGLLEGTCVSSVPS